MSRIVWLASYPKSGNTWVRVFLTNYIRNSDIPAEINELDGGPIASAREVFDEQVGLEASDLTLAEIERLRPAVYRAMVDQASNTIFMKVHDAWTKNLDGTPVVGEPEVTQAVIYLIRNPLDVVISFAHHSSSSIDKAADTMVTEAFRFGAKPGHLSSQLTQRLRSWSGHVRSWVDDSGLPVCVVRYEDLLADPIASFTAITGAAGLELDAERVARAVSFSRFEVLQSQEGQQAFKERSDRAESFFRKGVSGDWRGTLTDEQRDRIVTAHGDVMRRFGYEPGGLASETKAAAAATTQPGET